MHHNTTTILNFFKPFTRILLLFLFVPTLLHAQPFGDRLKTLTPPGFAIGGVLHGYDNINSFAYEPYRQVANDEFNAVTVTAYMPWGVWENPAQAPNTEGLQRVTTWALENNKRVHGHALVYPYANTHLPWFQALDSALVEDTLKRYVQTMARSTQGDMWVWDVVNEAIGDTYNIQNNIGVDDVGVRTGIERDGAFIAYPEYQAMGRDYISKAFYWADEADPTAELIINDYAVAEINPKSTALFNLVVDMKSRGVPIDGVGFQMHWTDPEYQPRFDNIRQNLQRFADAGFKLYITELDVAMVRTATPSSIDWSRQVQWRNEDGSTELIGLRERQARVYAGLLEVALSVPAVDAFLFWDYTDSQSWLNPGNDGDYLFAAPFWGGDSFGTHAIVPKPAYYAMQSVLESYAPDDDDGQITGTYRLTSRWDSDTSWLGRTGLSDGAGGSIPDSMLGLFLLNSTTRQWGSLKWTIEAVAVDSAGNSSIDNAVRIRNGWVAGSDYLSRDSTFDRPGWMPGTGIGLLPYDPNASGQLWNLEPAGNNRYRLKSHDDAQGAVYMTRDGIPVGVDTYAPGATVNLYSGEDWTSQIWELQQVTSD